MQNHKIIKKIKKIIALEGYISIYDFLDISLYDKKDGFYTVNKEILGAKGHFVTGPEISQIFGELVTIWLIDFLKKTNYKIINLIELGPGNGTLMADMLRVFKNIYSDQLKINLHFLESSEHLQIRQKKAINNYNLKVFWHKNFDNLEKKLTNAPCIFIANEFFDCLPINQYILTDGKEWESKNWKKLCVKYNENQFYFDNLPLENNEKNLIEEMLINHRANFSKEKKIKFLEISPLTNRIILSISKLLNKFNGFTLFLDYGKNNPFGNTLQAIYQNRKISFFEKIGLSDYTSLVDFSNIYNIARIHDLIVYPPISQRDFFLQLGILQRAELLSKNCSNLERRNLLSSVDRLISKKHMGEIFRVFCMTKENFQPIGFTKSNKENIYDNSFIS